jgi:hypothetical protein
MFLRALRIFIKKKRINESFEYVFESLSYSNFFLTNYNTGMMKMKIFTIESQTILCATAIVSHKYLSEVQQSVVSFSFFVF